MILSFLSDKNGALQSNKSLFVEKVQKIYSEDPQIHFYCIFKSKCFKIFRNSKFFVNRAAQARGYLLLGAFRPQKLEYPPTLAEKKFGRRHPEIIEHWPRAVVT